MRNQRRNSRASRTILQRIFELQKIDADTCLLKNLRMPSITHSRALLLASLLSSVVGAREIHPSEIAASELSAAALAYHLEIRELSFRFQLDAEADGFSFRPILLRKGEEVWAGQWITELSMADERQPKIDVVFDVHAESIKGVVVWKTGATHFTAERPEGCALGIAAVQPAIDAKGRVVLAFDVPMGERGPVITEETTTAEGADWALVLQVSNEFVDE